MIVFGRDREIPGVTISLSAEARERGSSRGDIRCEDPKAERGAQACLTQQRNKTVGTERGGGGGCRVPGALPQLCSVG